MTVKETILAETLRLFREQGISSLSEAQIRAHAGISHETFLEFFRDKDELVYQTVGYFIKKQKYEREHIIRQTARAAEATLFLLQNTVERVKSINPKFYGDLQQQYPDVWQEYLKYLRKDSYEQIYQVLNRGIQSGEFRKDINLAMVAKVIIEMFILLMNPEIFPPQRYNLLEVYRSIYFYYLRGLCVDEYCYKAEEFFSHI
jgi:AcrR family transcriptional regulator